MSPFSRWLLLASLALPLVTPVGHAQEATEEKSEETAAQKYVRLAREGRPVVRPQAARRLLELREEAIPILLSASGQDGAGVAGLGKELVAVLGEFDNAELRSHLWTSLDNVDFPWRPSAAGSLAKTANASEAERFDAMLHDPIGKVRVAALEALRQLDRREATSELHKTLSDSDDVVRRRTAALLADWGDPCSLYWLIEDLNREDRFFALRTGSLARYASLNLLKERLESTHEYSARKSPTDPANLAAVTAMRAELGALCKSAPELPEIARAGERSLTDVLGLELRSCRRGEFFLRWTSDDVLLVGTGNPTRIPLPKGTVAKLLDSATKLLGTLEGQFWGEPGCDIEQFHFQPNPDQRPRAFRVNKGQAAIKGLRPRALGELAQLCCATLPDEPGSLNPGVQRLASRVLEALERIGGKLPAAPIETR